MLLTVALIGSTMYRPYIYNHHSLNTGNTYSGPAGRLWGVSVTPLHRNDLFPHAETFAQVVEVPRHLPRRLRKPRKFRGIYRDVCASRASSAAFAETFAQAAQVPRHLPRRLRRSRKYRGICRGVCGTPANAKKFSERLAGIPQTPKSFPRDLRDSRKRQKVSQETCGTPANTKKFFERLAGLPQTPKSFPRHLRNSRKHLRLRQNVSPVATGIFFDPRGRRVIRKITTNYPIDPFINNK